jgi:RNA polymerase sigma-70 factor (ECF subfamily)
VSASDHRLERHRAELTRHCQRMLRCAFDAEDAVQETMVRAWRGIDRFQGRSELRVWLYRIADNVCLDMLDRRARRPVPVDVELTQPLALGENLLPAATDPDPAELVLTREAVKVALIAALERLPPRQRAALSLCEVLRWTAAETAELLGTSSAAINSALQRARATLESVRPPASTTAPELLARYVEAFEDYDIDRLVSLIRSDAARAPAYDDAPCAQAAA